MNFTDDYLKRLKEHISACGDCQTCLEMRLAALIARLEAAEAVCEAQISHECCVCENSDNKQHDYAYLCWRKAAGKL